MKIAQINITLRGSTGRIMNEIHSAVNKKSDMQCISFYGRGKKVENREFVKFGTELSFVFHVLYTFITNKQGHFAKFQTKKLINQIKEYDPDIIHMHNIQGYYVNYPMLFRWINDEFKGKVVWTLHDCWAFTGHCCHFTKAECNKWKIGCENCCQKHDFPYSLFFDTSKSEYQLKKKLFTSRNDFIITAPSYWLTSLIEKSFLNKHEICTINNWVDLDVFKPSDIQKNEKKIILGVANVWEERKGLNIFIELSKRISSDYQIVMVGLNKHQMNKLPDNIIGIERTENVEQLVGMYSNAYVFLNPSIEETFSLVTLEALACNTPVIVQDTSAVHEMVCSSCGIVLSDFKIDSYLNAIDKIKNIDRSASRIRDSILKYNKEDKISQYLELYRNEKGEV